jgi:heterodisulfide reductase subunit A
MSSNDEKRPGPSPGDDRIVSETDKSPDERRVGVYICHCGGNISVHVDVDRVRREVEKELGVTVAKTSMFTCSDASQQEIIEDIEKNNLDGMVVASCSPKLHLFTFRGVAERAGLNPYQYVQVNIREQASWPHSDDNEGATRKAIGLVKGGIEKVKRSEPLEPIRVTSVKKALIVGAGIAGMRASVEMADLGVEVFLIERSTFVGGAVARLGVMYPSGKRGDEVIARLTNEITKRDNITVFTNAELVGKEGYIGNFDVTVKVRPRHVTTGEGDFAEAIDSCPVVVPDEHNYGLTKRKAIYCAYTGAYPARPAIDLENCTKCELCREERPDAVDFRQSDEEITLNVGAIITATGFDDYEPAENEYGYGMEGVVTLPAFERMIDLADGRLVYNGREVKSVAFIYCVGSRQARDVENGNRYCSRYCCNAAVGASRTAAAKFDGLTTYHLYRDIRTYGKFELLYEDASRDGAVFVRFDGKEPPTVRNGGNGLLVTVKDLLTAGEEIEIPVDLVILATGMVPRENERLTAALRLPLGSDGFYNEIHPKLRPVETVIDGVYIGGCCQGPKNSSESIVSSLSAVSKAASLLVKGYVDLQPFIAYVKEDLCTWCGECEKACPYGAIEKVELGGREIARVIDMICKGCGACLPVCPYDASQLKGYTDGQIMSMIEAFVEEDALAR